MKKIICFITLICTLVTFTACSNAENGVKNQAPPVTKLEVANEVLVGVKQDNINDEALSTNKGSGSDGNTNKVVKKKVKQLDTELSKIFHEPDKIKCEYSGNFHGNEISFYCTYNIIKDSDYSYVWDIEDIECTEYKGKEKHNDEIKSHINSMMEHTSLRANLKYNEITYIVYDYTMAIAHGVENSVNGLKTPLLNKFERLKKSEFIQYDSDEGIKYRGAFDFVECFTSAIEGDLPFDLDHIGDCKLAEDTEQTDKKQTYSNGNTYVIEKIEENEYKISVTKSDLNYTVTLVIDN